MENRPTLAETSFCSQALQVLREAPWATQLVERLDRAGGVDSPSSRPYLFELRFAVELNGHDGVQYEYPAGVGNTTVEYRVASDPEWLIELVSLGISDPVSEAIEYGSDGSWVLELSSNADNCRHTEEREMVLAQEKILQKVFNREKQRPVKFPEVTAGRYHAIVADLRGYLGNGGGDETDFAQMAYGARGVPRELQALVHNWPPRYGKPIPGLFEKQSALEGASVLQQRIHFLVFVNEESFGPGLMGTQLHWAHNPWLFHDAEQARSVFATFPIVVPSNGGPR